MTRAGLPPPPQTDPRLARLLALATQKFISDVAADAYQYSRIRATNTNANNPMGNLAGAGGFPAPGQPAGQPGGKDQAKVTGSGAPIGIQRPGFGGGGQGNSQGRTVLTMEDLGMAVAEYGVNLKRSEFYR
jgi:transcription initiation factor TFIID subunit 10